MVYTFSCYSNSPSPPIPSSSHPTLSSSPSPPSRLWLPTVAHNPLFNSHLIRLSPSTNTSQSNLLFKFSIEVVSIRTELAGTVVVRASWSKVSRGSCPRFPWPDQSQWDEVGSRCGDGVAAGDKSNIVNVKYRIVRWDFAPVQPPYVITSPPPCIR